MTLSSLLGGSPTTPPTPAMYPPFMPNTDRGSYEWSSGGGGGGSGWKASGGGGSKGTGSAMSALTLLAFLFFLNILQNCLKENMMMQTTPTVMMMTTTPAANTPPTRLKRSSYGEDGEELRQPANSKGYQLSEQTSMFSTDKSGVEKSIQDTLGDMSNDAKPPYSLVTTGLRRHHKHDDLDVIGGPLPNQVDLQTSVKTAEVNNKPDNIGQFWRNEVISQFSADMATHSNIGGLRPNIVMPKSAVDITKLRKYMLNDNPSDIEEPLSFVTPSNIELRRPSDNSNQKWTIEKSIKFSDELTRNQEIIDLDNTRRTWGDDNAAESDLMPAGIASAWRDIALGGFDETQCHGLMVCEAYRLGEQWGTTGLMIASGFSELLLWMSEEHNRRLLEAAADDAESGKDCGQHIQRCGEATGGRSLLPLVATLLNKLL